MTNKMMGDSKKKKAASRWENGFAFCLFGLLPIYVRAA
jgi:hypothetical protein